MVAQALLAYAPPTMPDRTILYPMLAALVGVGCLALMDVAMKSAALAAGAFSASLLRSAFGAGMIAPVWLARKPHWPARPALKLHIERGLISAVMSLSWFYSLTKLPVAEAMALSFTAPLLALYFAHLLLGETIGRSTVLGAVLGFAGTMVIVGGRIGNQGFDQDAGLGLAALTFSAVLYAYSFVIIRRQSQLAGPVEIATFHSSISALAYLVAAPLFFTMPETQALSGIAIAAALTVGGAMAIAWAYARAEAQVLVPFEYTGFVWAAAFGWLLLGEAVTLATIAGAVIIVAGCWIAAPGKPTEQTAI